MVWPVFYGDLLKIGNPDSNVVVCTLWTPKDVIYNKIPKEKYCVCGNLYTAQGINPLIKNILSNPKIRYIILCGKEMTDSGASLLNFMEKGVDENMKIIGSNAYIDSNIGFDMIEKIRKNITVIDMRGKEDEIVDTIDTLPCKEAFSEPVLIERDETTYPTVSDENAFLIRGKTIAEIWLNILDIIMKFGEEKPSEYGIKQKEILDVMAVIETQEEKIMPWLKFTDEDLKRYYQKFFSSEKSESLSYTYGERLFKYPLVSAKEKSTEEIKSTFDQIEGIVERLRKTPYTRRAIAFTWNMNIDTKSENPPCLTQISWNIKNNLLYQTAVLRSNDMFGAWPMNAFALKELQKKIADRLNLKTGYLIMISNSAHIYENNWKECREILQKFFVDKMMSFEQDKLGYFVISIENEEIVVQHHINDGRKSDFVFRGKSAIELYRRILHENLVSRFDHAAYLGKELIRAEIALRENKKYFQDEA
jgi:thymidylate synthase